MGALIRRWNDDMESARPMMKRRIALLLAITLTLAACASSAASTPPESAAATRIEVTLTDALRMEPASMTVPAGVPVTFVVTNAGALEHEFYLGDEAAQMDHEEEMAMGGMAHGDPSGISVAPGTTEELTFTFPAAGAVLAGCHVAGHYLGGMKADITVTE